MSRTMRFGRPLALPSTLQIRRELLQLMLEDELQKLRDRGEREMPDPRASEAAPVPV